MLERFGEPTARNRVITALRDQSLIGGEGHLAEDIYEHVVVESFPAGSFVLDETSPDDHVCFVLAGSVSIRVSDRQVATRTAGQHIGEMAALDPGKPRSASAVALDDVVVAKLSATNFTTIAYAYPRLWRNVARDLAERLRQRNRFVSPMNSEPVLFVGSSAEVSPIASAIRDGLVRSSINVRLWSENIFVASTFPLESLEQQLATCDFAALVVSPDDQVVSRSVASDAPRDNIVFELGLFMGALGHERVFLVCPRNVPIKIPSDLLGLTVLRYDVTDLPSASLEQVNDDLRCIILKAGPR